MKYYKHIRLKYSMFRWIAAPAIPIIVALGLVLVAQANNTRPTKTTQPDLDEHHGRSAHPSQPTEPEPELSPIDLDQFRQQAYSVLRNALEHEEPLVREAVLKFVRLANESDWQERLVGRLGVEEDPRVRAWVAITLGVLGARRARARVEDLRNAADPRAQPVLRVWHDHALALLGDRTASWRLYRAASSKDLEVSLNASLILSQLAIHGDQKAIRKLQELIARETELVVHDRFAGVTILASMARLGHKHAREQLRTHLHHSDEGVRLSSARALADIGDDAGRETLFDIFNNSTSRLRLNAAAALVTLGDYDGTDMLLQCALDTYSRERKLCISSLSTVGFLDHARALRRLYEEDDRVVSVAAATSVLLILGLQPQVLSRESIDWVTSALQSSDWTMRRDAIAVTVSLPPEVSVPLLAQAVLDDHVEVRQKATEALGRSNTDDAARRIAAASQTEKNLAVKQAQIQAMARIGSPVVADTLLAQSQNQDRLGMLATGAYIAVLNASANTAQVTEACERLTDSYEHGRTSIRQAVMESALIADNPIVVPTLEMGLSDRVFDIRLAAAEGMAHYRVMSDRAVEVLRAARDRSAALSARATVALLKLGASINAGAVLESMLNQSDAGTRLAATRTIAELAWSDARPLLSIALTDNEPAVRQQAIETIDAFLAEHPGDSIHMLKTRVRDTDAATRMKAKAHLAPLLRKSYNREPVAPEVEKPEEHDHRPLLGPSQIVSRRSAGVDAGQERLCQTAGAKRQLEKTKSQLKEAVAERQLAEDKLRNARTQIQEQLKLIKRHGLNDPNEE